MGLAKARQPACRARRRGHCICIQGGNGACLFACTALREPPVRIVYVTETYPPEVNGVALTVARMYNLVIQQINDRNNFHNCFSSD